MIEIKGIVGGGVYRDKKGRIRRVKEIHQPPPRPKGEAGPPVWPYALERMAELRWEPEDRDLWNQLRRDMKERDLIGRKRYGTPLCADNGRDPMADGYQEAIDLYVYLCQAEMEGRIVGALAENVLRGTLDLLATIREQLDRQHGD